MVRQTNAKREPSIPELMRIARGSYKQAIDRALSHRGIDDLPRSGGFVLAHLLRGNGAVEELVDGLGITRQSFSQLVEVLVTRGYVSREIHPGDRRRMVLSLTASGVAAAEAVLAGTKAVDRQLASRLSAAELAGLRRGLAVLGEIKAYSGRHSG